MDLKTDVKHPQRYNFNNADNIQIVQLQRELVYT